MSDITIWVGHRIQSLRKQRGWTQEILAEYAELHVSYIATLEKGKKNPSIEVLKRISDAFELSLPEFFEDTSSPAQNGSASRQQKVERLLHEYSKKLTQLFSENQ